MERSRPMRELSLIGVAAIALLGIIPASSAATACDPSTVTGTPGDDKDLRGTSGVDVIDALAGADWATALRGDDRICLGPGGSEAFTAPFEGEIAWGGGG